MMAMGRLISALVIAAMLGGVAASAALAGPETAPADGWQVLESHGGARFQPAREQSWWPARSGSRIPHGSIISTGSSGFLIIASGGESITVRPNSRVELPDEASGGQVRQTAGDLRYRITRVPDRRFGVETPYLSLLVKGTVFDVVVGDRGTQVQVTEGRVQVDAPRGQVLELAPGQGARIAAGAQADLEFRPAPESPFAAAPFSRRPIAAAYTDHADRLLRDRAPTAGQTTSRSDRPVLGLGDHVRAGSDAAASRDRMAAGAGNAAGAGVGRPRGDVAANSAAGAAVGIDGPAEGRERAGAAGGIEIGVSESGMWIDATRAPDGEVARDPDPTIRSARADIGTRAGSESALAAPPPPQTTVAAGSSAEDAGMSKRPRATATEATNRAEMAAARGWRRSDMLLWATFVVLAATLWWRLRRSPNRSSSGQGSAWHWLWQRTRHDASASDGAASPAFASRRALRDRT
jgi:FecR protein